MLTDDMTRLRREIFSMRRRRADLMNDLQSGATERKEAVTEVCSRMSNARAAMAVQTRKDRMAFLKGLQRSVATERRAMRTDLAGARRVWAGKRA